MTQAASWTQPRNRRAERSHRRAIRPNWAKKLWHRSTALRTLPTPGCFWPRLGGLQAEAGRLGPLPGRPVAVGPVGPRPSAGPARRPRPAGSPAAGGRITIASRTSWAWHAVVGVGPGDRPRPAAWPGCRRPGAAPCRTLPRSTGEGPVCSPPFLTASWSRRGGPGPS